jgi:hypothetical protein
LARSLITLFTSAPAACDGFSAATVRTLPYADRRGLPVREVTVMPRDYAWLMGSYGLMPSTNGRFTLADMIRHGIWTPTA